MIFLYPAYFYIQNNILMFVCGYLQDSSTPKVNTFSVSSSWFCCIGFSFCNFMRLMTLSHTCEASLTKIQQHNVHSIFVSFFFLLHWNGIPISFKPSWIPPCSGYCTMMVPVLGECFCQTDGKASLCCTHSYTHTSLLVISWPALTFSHSLQSELICQSCSFPLKTDVCGTSN